MLKRKIKPLKLERTPDNTWKKIYPRLLIHPSMGIVEPIF
jgi:hypothetical protein